MWVPDGSPSRSSPVRSKKPAPRFWTKRFITPERRRRPGSLSPTRKMGLVEGRDYQISYSSNTSKGKGIITLTGIGNYSSTRTLKFTISATENEGSKYCHVGYSGYVRRANSVSYDLGFLQRDHPPAGKRLYGILIQRV